MSPRKASDLTVTDQFCGAGGSSIGAHARGLRVRMALNHWKRAIETHNTNFPDTDHDCTDISACDPRRYPSTDILITSPECTTHSPAGGTRKMQPQRDLFRPLADDPDTERSRATMYDVPRFAEYHRYNAIIVENVVEVLRWELFDSWLALMHRLGYKHKVVCLNSMFCWPTPQSRDRIYIVFWRAGNRAPKLDFQPPAFCTRCEKVVAAKQSWKNGRTVGKYKTQYVYACPQCRQAVQPYFYAALNAIDFSIPAERIGDRQKPLKPRTMERIAYGLKKYGRRSLVIRTNMTSGVGCRVRDAESAPMDAQPATNITALVSPATIMRLTGDRRVHGLDAPLSTQIAECSQDVLLTPQPFIATQRSHNIPTKLDEAAATFNCREHHMLIQHSPFIVETAFSHSEGDRTRGTDEIGATQSARQTMGIAMPGRTQTTAQTAGIVIPNSFLTTAGGRDSSGAIDEAAPTQIGTERFAVVRPAALMSLRDADAMHVGGLDESTKTQTAAQQAALIAPSRFLIQQYNDIRSVSWQGDAIPTVSTLDRHSLVESDAELKVEDCHFRMLQPHEIGRAMAFPDQYIVLGTKREKIKQYGNAVTPPVMEWIIGQVAASLHPELAEESA